MPLASRAMAGRVRAGPDLQVSSASRAEIMSGRAPLTGSYTCPGSL